MTIVHDINIANVYYLYTQHGTQYQNKFLTKNSDMQGK